MQKVIWKRGKCNKEVKEITKRSKLPDVQGKVRDQVAIGFRLGSGWPRVWCKFLKSITEHNRATLIQSWTGGDTVENQIARLPHRSKSTTGNTNLYSVRLNQTIPFAMDRSAVRRN